MWRSVQSKLRWPKLAQGCELAIVAHPLINCYQLRMICPSVPVLK
ncbi:hypothetical protein QWZ13_03205 [Reinekea marina]|nr:hypothetical protein [Reinekea marina]MDN3647919.1 hypothetical protein [Reinekea marina]